MAVVVRLRRMGTTNKPFFRVVAADERTSNNGRFLENLGWYAPRQKGANYELNMDRVEYWKGVGARTTETVDSLIRKARRAGRESVEVKQEVPGKAHKVADLPTEMESAPPADEAQPPANEENAAEAEAVAEEKAPEADAAAEEPAADDSRKTAAPEEKEES